MAWNIKYIFAKKDKREGGLYNGYNTFWLQFTYQVYVKPEHATWPANVHAEFTWLH